MNFLKLTYEVSNGTVLPILYPFALVETSFFKASSAQHAEPWANTTIITPSGVTLLVIETTDEILAALDGLTTASVVDAKNV